MIKNSLFKNKLFPEMKSTDKINPLELLLHASVFAAEKHKFQRRKGFLKIPYINHPLKVCKILIDVHEEDKNILCAAILHDTLEDTETTETEIKELFGEKVLKIVMEVSDDMSLPSKIRKELQIKKAPSLSREAKLIKIADKASNIADLIAYPIKWDKKRKIQYVEWSTKVFEKCRGQNAVLDALFEKTSNDALRVFKQ